jgi:hypothetical protein
MVLTMQSKIISLWIPEGSSQATMLVRRADGRLALSGIDARVARAAGIARELWRDPELSSDPESAQNERELLGDLPVALEAS